MLMLGLLKFVTLRLAGVGTRGSNYTQIILIVTCYLRQFAKKNAPDVSAIFYFLSDDVYVILILNGPISAAEPAGYAEVKAEIDEAFIAAA